MKSLRVGLLVMGIVIPRVVTLAASEPKLTLHLVVPQEFRNSKAAPNGDPEPVRYTKAYEAFWWNCVIVRGRDLNAHCPFTCSGTPAATPGCAAGASNANDQIDALVKRTPAREIQAYLKEIGSSPRARQGLSGYGYFRDGPRAEDVPR